jgi:hypothetical protein
MTRDLRLGVRDDLRLAFELNGCGVNRPGAWRRLYGEVWGYYQSFGWRAAFWGGGCE